MRVFFRALVVQLFAICGLLLTTHSPKTRFSAKLMLRSQAELPISRRSLLTCWTLPLAFCLSLSRPKTAHAFTRQSQKSISSRTTPSMSYSFGRSITQQSRGSHSATVIFLHGLGDTGNGWAPVGQQLNIPHVKFIFPTAPTRQASSF